MIQIPHPLLAWSPQPVPLADLALGAVLYARGFARLGRRAGGRARPSRWRAMCFVAGLVLLAVAIVSPLDTYDGVLFVVHMLQHLVIAWIAPPLLWLGEPLTPLLWTLPAVARRRLGGWFRRGRLMRRITTGLAAPVASLTVFLAVVAAWHVPSLYDAAQGHTLIHNLEHLTFFVAGLLYWWPIVQGVRGRGPLAPMGGALLYVLAPASEGGLIGGAFTFSDRVVYPYYAHPAAAAGISPLADQHLAGIVMWLGGGLISVLTAAVLIGCFLAAEDRIGRDRLPSAPSTAPGPHSPRRPDETPG